MRLEIELDPTDPDCVIVWLYVGGMRRKFAAPKTTRVVDLLALANPR